MSSPTVFYQIAPKLSKRKKIVDQKTPSLQTNISRGKLDKFGDVQVFRSHRELSN